MTGEGMLMKPWPHLNGPDVVVELGNGVELFNGWTGYCVSWTEDGFMLRLDKPFQPFTGGGFFPVLAIEVRDGDIVKVFKQRKAAS